MTEITAALMQEIVWAALEDPNCGFDPEMLGTKLAVALSERQGETYRCYPRFVPVWGDVFDRQKFTFIFTKGENAALEIADELNNGADPSQYLWERYQMHEKQRVTEAVEES